MALDFFYDSQIRRYILQFVRIFSGFQYQYGRDANGNFIYRQIPATYASMNRQAQSILQNNSENITLSAPQISCSINAIKPDADRRQDPSYVRTLNVWERDVDKTTNQYTEKLGRISTVESYMPVPYELTMQTDIWTTNETQKQQILEQILVLFNPSIDLQTSNNFIDWTVLTIVELIDIVWSSRSYPAGTTDQIDVVTLKFKLPIFLNAPSKVKRANIIQQIVIDIGQLEDIHPDASATGDYFSESDLLSRQIITPQDYHVSVNGNEITLLTSGGKEVDNAGNSLSWITLLEEYGKFRNNISQIKLHPSNVDLDNTTQDIVGVLELNPNDTSKLFWTVNLATLPANTLSALTGVIDPLAEYPNKGLASETIGQRYLLLNHIPESVAWLGLTANTYDIIEYTANGWRVVFDSSSITTSQYVVNTFTGQQLHWNGTMWHLSIDGEYTQGYWRLNL